MKTICSFLLGLMMATVSYAQKDKNKLMDDEYEVKFLRTATEGSILFKVYTYGKNEEACLENAKRNAVKAVLFTGIPGSDLQKPLVTAAGAVEAHKDFFNAFFQKGGKYLQYVALSTDGSIEAEDRLRVGKLTKIGVAVLVQKAALRKQMEDAGVIKSLGSGF
ncbi:hypothetical protein [Pedobacter sp. GR22-6]|uniref:hypothetical protein n=1 Tax=Pedobacter sp. GR22-6 TaxID=3127957 RepID=UPI00307EF542